mgnify:CR=1 FL=1
MNYPGYPLTPRLVDFLKHCYNDEFGGFGGGPGQYGHLAPTYAAVSALAICGTSSAYELLKSKRESLNTWLLALKNPDGSFCMHQGGEADMRSSYCALVVIHLLQLQTPHLIRGCAEFVQSCQSYDGGLGGEPGNEPHGGYAYCGYASLVILNRTDILDQEALLVSLLNPSCS